MPNIIRNSGGGKALEIFNFPITMSQNLPTPSDAKRAGHIWVIGNETDYAQIKLNEYVTVDTDNTLYLKVDDTNNGSDLFTQSKKVGSTKMIFTSSRDSANANSLPWQVGLTDGVVDIKRNYPLIYSRLAGVLDMRTAYVWTGTAWIILSQQGSTVIVDSYNQSLVPTVSYRQLCTSIDGVLLPQLDLSDTTMTHVPVFSPDNTYIGIYDTLYKRSGITLIQVAKVDVVNYGEILSFNSDSSKIITGGAVFGFNKETNELTYLYGFSSVIFRDAKFAPNDDTKVVGLKYNISHNSDNTNYSTTLYYYKDGVQQYYTVVSYGASSDRNLTISTVKFISNTSVAVTNCRLSSQYTNAMYSYCGCWRIDTTAFVNDFNVYDTPKSSGSSYVYMTDIYVSGDNKYLYYMTGSNTGSSDKSLALTLYRVTIAKNANGVPTGITDKKSYLVGYHSWTITSSIGSHVGSISIKSGRLYLNDSVYKSEYKSGSGSQATYYDICKSWAYDSSTFTFSDVKTLYNSSGHFPVNMQFCPEFDD